MKSNVTWLLIGIACLAGGFFAGKGCNQPKNIDEKDAIKLLSKLTEDSINKKDYAYKAFLVDPITPNDTGFFLSKYRTDHKKEICTKYDADGKYPKLGTNKFDDTKFAISDRNSLLNYLLNLGNTAVTIRFYIGQYDATKTYSDSNLNNNKGIRDGQLMIFLGAFDTKDNLVGNFQDIMALCPTECPPKP